MNKQGLSQLLSYRRKRETEYQAHLGRKLSSYLRKKPKLQLIGGSKVSLLLDIIMASLYLSGCCGDG